MNQTRWRTLRTRSRTFTSVTSVRPTCTITSLVLLPALLTWLRPGSDEKDRDVGEEVVVSADDAQRVIGDEVARLAA